MVGFNEQKLRSVQWPALLSREERDVYRQIPSEVDHVENSLFAAKGTEERLFGAGAAAINVADWTHFPEEMDELPAPRARKVALSGRQEGELFLRYNYARYRLGQLIQAQQRRFSAARARPMVLWFRRTMHCKEDLARANMALVVAMAKRTRIPNVEFSELISEGNMALLRSIEKFDVSRGFKFSTYACRAILKSFNRLASKAGRYRRLFPTEFDPELEKSDNEADRREADRRDTVDQLRFILRQNRAGLSDVERTVVAERFALGGDGQARTLSEVGQMVGLTNERVRQIQNLALGKLRAAMEGADRAA